MDLNLPVNLHSAHCGKGNGPAEVAWSVSGNLSHRLARARASTEAMFAELENN